MTTREEEIQVTKLAKEIQRLINIRVNAGFKLEGLEAKYKSLTDEEFDQEDWVGGGEW